MTPAQARKKHYLSTTTVAAHHGVSARSVCLWAECGEILGGETGPPMAHRRSGIFGVAFRGQKLRTFASVQK